VAVARKQPYGIDWRDPARFAPTYDLRHAPEDYKVLLHQHAQDDLGTPEWRSVPKVHPVTAHPIGPLHNEVKGWEFDDRMDDDPEYINALVVAIKEGYPLPPAVIGHLGAAEKGVVDGRHRILAAKKAGLTHVPVIDLDHATWQDARRPGFMAKSADELRPLAKMALVYSHATKPTMVWRVQNAEGLGPYHAAGLIEGGEVPGAQSRQPEPEADFTARELRTAGIDDEYGGGTGLFGFEQPEHAERWFGGSGGLRKLASAGFKLTQVPARKVWRGASGHQVMFVPHESDPFESGRAESAQAQGFSKSERVGVPNGHRSYMRVPKGEGGASCASCRYLTEDGKGCTSKFFQQWNNGSAQLPYPADESCSDWYEPREAALEKAIKDIPAGRHSSGTGTWDYSHLLKPEQRDMDYRLRVRASDDQGVIYATIHRGDSEAFGGVKGVLLTLGPESRGTPVAFVEGRKPKRKALEPHAYLGLPGPMKNKGFGRAMYEALYSHAMKKHGVKVVQGGYHTAAARRVHESLARRHGLDYAPEPGFESEPGEPPRGGPYEYMLKGEVPPATVAAMHMTTVPGNSHRTMGELVPSMMRKALSEVPLGRKLDDHRWDYGHLLTPELRDEGYQLHVTVPPAEDPRDSSVNGLLIHHGEDVGHVWGVGDPKDKLLFIESSGVQQSHRRKGLGKALYEAVMAHALNAKGYERVEGDTHSTRAHQVHVSLGKKHGMDYSARKMRDGRPHDYDDAYGPYSNLLKGDQDSMPKCPKCGSGSIQVEVHGEPLYVCKDCDKKWVVPFPKDMEKADDSFDARLRAGWEHAKRTGSLMRGPAFRHFQTGQVMESPIFHDADILPAGEYDQGLWEDGFVDHQGKFHNRAEAAKAVGVPVTPGREDEPGFLESYDYTNARRQGLLKSEAEPAFERPRWVEDPQLPARVQRIYDTVRANLTQDLLKPEYQGNPNPFHGHCYVATEALWHLLDGDKTGWERMHLATAQGPHWFLQHKKTGVILDPTAEQFPKRPAYEKAKPKGFTVGPPDYDPTKPSKRAQTLIDRVKPALRKSEDDAELADLAKSVGFIKFPKLGAEDVQEPMTYPAGTGAAGYGRKGRSLFGARFQLANWYGGRSDGEHLRQRGGDVQEVAKERGYGLMGVANHPNKPMLPEERTTSGFVLGGKQHGLVGTRAHEAQHSVFGQLAQKYGDEARQKAIQHVISKLSPEGVEAGRAVMGTSGYSLKYEPEEFITAHQQFLTDEKSRKAIYKALGMKSVEGQRAFFKLMRQNFELMRHAATQVTPRMIAPPRLKSKAKRKLRKNESDLQKSIAAIPAGLVLAHNPTTNESLHDYSHVLPKQLQAEGWKLRVHHVPRVNSVTARVYDPAGQRQGSLVTFHDVQQGEPVLGIDTAAVKPEHRGKGLGLALYEASYAHGRNRLGLRKVVGDEHTRAAHGVHEALARKHGMKYVPDFQPGDDVNEMAGPYEYMLKGEVSPGLENSDIGTTLADGTEVTKGMVKSEDWSPADWEEQAAVLMKAAKALPGQLGLPGLGDEVFDPVEYDRRMEEERRQFEQEYDRQVAAGQLSRERWGATWGDRVTKGQLQPGEADEFIRRITQPGTAHQVPGFDESLNWDSPAREDRPALSAGNIDHFLTHHWDKLTPEQRAAIVASPHGDVSDWTHSNHNRLSDEKFQKVMPTLQSRHFWGQEGELPEHRVQMMLDWAKATPRPEGEAPEARYEYGKRAPAVAPPTGLDPQAEQEKWYPWTSAWETMRDVAQYTSLSDAMSWKMLTEFPKDHPEYNRMMYHVADNPGLSDQHRAMLLNEVERQAKDPASSSYQQGGVLRGLLAHAQDPQLQRRVVDAAIRYTQHGALADGLAHNKRLDPSTVRLVADHGPRSALLKAVSNPAFPTELLPEMAKLQGGDTSRAIRIAAAEHPAATEELVREIAEKDKRSEVRKAAHKVLAWHDPSSVHDEHVDVGFGTGKLRQLRDLIVSKGQESMPPKELPPGDWKAVRDEKGNISVKKIDEFIESQPKTKYGVSESTWSGPQRHSREKSWVFQLNLSTDQVKKLKEAGVYETFRRMHQASTRSNHPVGHVGLGWVRWTGDEKGIHIDEVQSDLGQSFVKQAANQARMQGQDEAAAAKRAEREYPEEHFQKIKDIVFGGKHPSEVLTEGFLQYLRNGKKANRTGYNRYTGTPFQYGGRPSYVGTQVHIWQPDSKATISLRHAEDKPLPGHFQVGYRDVPQKRLGMKPATYGDLPTQTARKHAGKATWGDTLRKREPGSYITLGKVGE
jgi:GNAT superfamily N-acetyltransferase